MEILMFPQTPARSELEEIWRRRLEKSHARYKTATQCYRRLLQQTLDGRRPVGDSALARAREAKSYALMEYLNIVGGFF